MEIPININNTEKKPRSILFTSIIMFVVGLGLLIGAVFIYSTTRKFVATAKTAEGTVFDIVLVREISPGTPGAKGGGMRDMFYPRVRFVTEDGITKEFQSRVGASPPAYRLGEKVKVLYDPANPYDAQVASFLSLWGLPLLLFVMGAFFIFFGLVSINYYMKLKRASPTIREQDIKPT